MWGRYMAHTWNGTHIPGDCKRSSVNESNHLPHRILELTEDGNGMTEVWNKTLRGVKRRMSRIEWLTVHVEGMKRRFLGALSLGSRDSLEIGESGCTIRVGRWL